MNDLFEKVQKLLKEGKSRVEIANILDCQKSTVNYYANPKNWEKFERKQKTQTKRLEFEEAILSVVNQASSLSDICNLIGICRTRTNKERVSKFLEERDINPEWKQKQSNRKPQGYWNKETIFVENSDYQTCKLKDRLVEYGFREMKCEICGNIEWQGKPIPLQTHHINGNHKDNRVENLQILCPNCHAQTDNYCGKNIPKSKYELKNKVDYKPREYSYDKYSKEDIEQEINSPEFKSYAESAKKLGLDRHTFKYLIDRYNLPTKEDLGKSKSKLESIICEYCGKTFKPARSGAKYCSIDCFKLANGQPIGEPPTREEILSQVNNYNTMGELAKHFGYKDLRHPCKKAGLPLSIKELRKLI